MRGDGDCGFRAIATALGMGGKPADMRRFVHYVAQRLLDWCDDDTIQRVAVLCHEQRSDPRDTLIEVRARRAPSPGGSVQQQQHGTAARSPLPLHTQRSGPSTCIRTPAPAQVTGHRTLTILPCWPCLLVLASRSSCTRATTPMCKCVRTGGQPQLLCVCRACCLRCARVAPPSSLQYPRLRAAVPRTVPRRWPAGAELLDGVVPVIDSLIEPRMRLQKAGGVEVRRVAPRAAPRCMQNQLHTLQLAYVMRPPAGDPPPALGR